MSIWDSGEAYEPYIGRWSRLVAREFHDWLGVPPGSHWLDVGCGTGALSATLLALAAPRELQAIDLSHEFVAYARSVMVDSRATFQVGDAQALPFETGRFDAAVSGLVLNFLPRPEQGLAEMARVTRAGGTVGVYIWDYAGRMDVIRRFWEAAAELDPSAHDLDEGRRFPLCQPEALERLFSGAGLREITTRAIEPLARYRDFDDYWSPFLGGQGPAPAYTMSLDGPRRAALRERLRVRLPIAADGSIQLPARAWAVRGRIGGA